MNTRKSNRGAVRLSESKLKAIIAESVQKVLNEYYDDYDPYWDDPDAEFRDRAEDAFEDIRNGRYDNMLPQWVSGERDVYDDLNLELDMGAYGIEDAVKDRWCVIDKSAALKYGKNPSDYPKYKKDYEIEYPEHRNRNIRDTSYLNKLGDEYWRDKEYRDIQKKMPHTFTKKGKHRKSGDVLDNIEKDIFGTDQADKRPLHRKGSLNRI